MKGNLKGISANNTLDFYTNEKHFPNQELVRIRTIEYFENGEGSRAFRPHEFLDLLWHQFAFINANIDKGDKVLDTLTNLPLTELEKHILFGFIIKWIGGYPLEAPSGNGNSRLHYQFRKLLLQKFLAYDGHTPEKNFCRIDFEQRKELLKLGIACTIAINTGTDVSAILDAMPRKQRKRFILGLINYSKMLFSMVQ